MTKRGTWGTILLGLGFVFCPCHLLITLPLLAAWLGGTAISGFLGANLAFIGGLSSVLFVAFMGLGWWLISQKDTCHTEPKKEQLEARYGTQNQNGYVRGL